MMFPDMRHSFTQPGWNLHLVGIADWHIQHNTEYRQIGMLALSEIIKGLTNKMYAAPQGVCSDGSLSW